MLGKPVVFGRAQVRRSDLATRTLELARDSVSAERS